MTNAIQNRIRDALTARPNQKADELARLTGCSRATVNRQLFGPLKNQVKQDRSYRWSLAEGPREVRSRAREDTEEHFANTDLALLCRYYLACLGYDENGVSAFLTSKYGDPDYSEVRTIPYTPEDLSDCEAGRKLLARRRTERGRYGLYFGYPTSISLLKSRRTNWQGFMVEPLLLFPIEQEGNGGLTVDLSFPIINQKPFQSFTNVERDMLMGELVQLEQELGLGGENERLEIDEIARRLQAIRPEWPWREDVDPDALEDERPPMADIDSPGIYNRAVILMAERSPFTQGLEKELRDLAQLSSDRYANTALGNWLSNGDGCGEQSTPLSVPLLEVLPMNSEQRQAVVAGLMRPVTIITGPPGTGKSQVVTNLLANAAWSGKRILLASKNNKAVDVVETRINELGPRPILLRVGASTYQIRLAEYVLSLLSATTSAAEKEEFADAKASHERLLKEQLGLAEEANKFVELRNEVDNLERGAEEARQHLGGEVFARALELDFPAIVRIVKNVSDAAKRADREVATFLARVIWPIFRKARFNNLAEALSASKASFREIGLQLPNRPVRDADVQPIREVVKQAVVRLIELEKAILYRKTLRKLQVARPLEEIARAEAFLLERIARHSENLCKLWLVLQPSSLSPGERQKLGRYTSNLKMVIEAGDQGQLSKTAYAQYSRMLREISHLLPCWAVTSLSARGRLPFEPGAFDIVVFDEASQCDIASALPLLYRAKSVVIIGDPKQLSHISSLPNGQDQALLERHGLMEKFPHWAYSYQSLFGIGALHVSGDDIVSLVDHHRSHADIINFSNDEFYEERLRVATKYDYLKTPNCAEAGIRWIDVKGRAVRPTNGGALNEPEAKAVVATLRDLLINKGYQGSVGVVTPFRAQANAITEAVNGDEELASLLIQRGFLADTVHKFQGDERDVMIFSPVVSSGLPSGALGFLRANGNLFNVAITRARAQLIVVGDLVACGASEIDYLSRFAAYTVSLKDQSRDTAKSQLLELGPSYPKVARPELVSDWEKLFYVAAYKAGLRLIPQYSIEKYIVDFLMIDGSRKLVIEIDGERYHRNWTGELCRRDQLRNQRLFELGYDVLRFWVYEVRDDLDRCLNRVKTWQNQEPRHDFTPIESSLHH